MEPTDTGQADYFHKVVDCQWACPAHTDVPEYIRLIAQGRFTDAYMVNRESNVFPGILGRVCDRPCEPACRRGRIESKPVAICRLKRVAADQRDDISALLPRAPQSKNGRHIACIGAGPASLTVANDLLPLGYEVAIFEQFAVPGGLMRTNIPAFRLPARVLDEEIGYILDMGADLRLNSPVHSMRQLLAAGQFGAVFVGTGAPKGKELELPGRHDSERVHIGIAWLESVAFKHTEAIGERVLIIGVGNTAMDCCRTSLRLGAKDVKVMARRPREFFKASEWELEDAEQENVQILINRAPKRFVVDSGRLEGMLFEHLEYEIHDGEITRPRARRGVLSARRRHPRHRPGERVPVDRARPRRSSFDKWDVPLVDKTTFQSTLPKCSSAAMRRSDRRTSSGRSSTATRPRSPSTATARASRSASAWPRGMNLQSRKMGMHEWSYANDYTPVERRLMPHVSLKRALQEAQHRGRARLHRRAGRAGSAALPQLRRADGVQREAVHRMRRLPRHLPGRLPHHHPQRTGAELRTRLKAPAKNLRAAAVRVRPPCRRPPA